MSSKKDERQSTSCDIGNFVPGNGQSAPVCIPYRNTLQVRKNNNSYPGSCGDSSTDSSLPAKRQLEIRQYLIETKRKRNNNGCSATDQTEECDSFEQQLSRFARNCMGASQESHMSSQRSIGEDRRVFEGDALCVSDDDILSCSPPDTRDSCTRRTSLPAGPAGVKSKRAGQAKRNATTKEPQLSGSSSDGKNSKGMSTNDAKKKENNRKYAKDSRNRKKEKLESLEQLTAQQECIIEIYKKTINIYHKRLMNEAVPSWSPHEINWQTGSCGNQKCQLIKCFLPILDDHFLEELGNGPYGKIVTNGTSKMLHTVPILYPDQKCKEIVSDSKAHDDLSAVKLESDVGKCRQRTVSFNTTEYSNSGSVPKHLSQATAPNSSDKSGSKILTLVNMDTNGSNMCAKSHINSLPIVKYEPNDSASQNYVLVPKKEIVTTFDDTLIVGMHTNLFHSSHDYSSKMTQPSCYLMPNSVCDSSQFLGNQNSTCLSVKKVNPYGSVLSGNDTHALLALIKDVTSSSKIPVNSMSNSSWSVGTPKYSTAHVSSQNKDKVIAENFSSSSFSCQDTNDQYDSDDVECLQASLEIVND